MTFVSLSNDLEALRICWYTMFWWIANNAQWRTFRFERGRTVVNDIAKSPSKESCQAENCGKSKPYRMKPKTTNESYESGVRLNSNG